jgi:tRNA nucleotidyltransferase (CCA-adding enzyme)
MKENVKRLTHFRFNDKQLNELVDFLKEKIEQTPFKGHVFLKGNVIRNQLLKLPTNPRDFYLIIDKPQGGVTFPMWLAYQCGIYEDRKNPLCDYKKGESVIVLKNKTSLSDLKIQCFQTKLEYLHNDESTPVVNYSDIETDAEACGLTIDSFYYNIEDECLYDFTGKAFDDIEKNIIRATDTKNVFKDDPSKILYAIRIATELHFGIEKNTWLSIIENVSKIADLKITKLREELDKILLTSKPSDVIRKMEKCNCLDDTWPHLLCMQELVNTPYQRSDSVYEHTLGVLDRVPAILDLRLGALFHDIGKINSNDSRYLYHELLSSELTEKLMDVMGYSDATIDRVLTMIEHHEDLSKFGGREVPGTRFIRKFREKLGTEFENTLLLIDANNKSQTLGKKVNQVKLFKEAVNRLDIKDAKAAKNRQLNNLPSVLPINGNDIKKEFGIKSGPIIGSLLDKVKEEYVKDPSIDKQECMSICREQIQMIS